jgi:hypothetical protein
VIAAIIERLTQQAPILTSVRPAEDLEALGKGTAARNGDCFVLPFQDRPQPNAYATGAVSQLVEVLFLVAFVLRRQDDAKGGRKAGSYDTFKDAVEAALHGWAPGDGNAPCELAAGRSASLGNGVTIYVQTWRTDRYLRSV